MAIRGRPKGGHNRRTEEAMVLAQASGMTPLEHLLMDMRDETLGRADRRDAAKAAAPYVHARLSTIEANVKGNMTLVNRVERLIVDPAPA